MKHVTLYRQILLLSTNLYILTDELRYIFLGFFIRSGYYPRFLQFTMFSPLRHHMVVILVIKAEETGQWRHAANENPTYITADVY
jgi:hypothetical protein